MAVARGRERLVAERHRDERRNLAERLQPAGRRARIREDRGELGGELVLRVRGGGERGAPAALADRERGELQRARFGERADRATPHGHRERLAGELTVELAQRLPRGVRAHDGMTDRIVRRRGDVADERVRGGLGIGHHVRAGARPRQRGPSGE